MLSLLTLLGLCGIIAGKGSVALCLMRTRYSYVFVRFGFLYSSPYRFSNGSDSLSGERERDTRKGKSGVQPGLTEFL